MATSSALVMGMTQNQRISINLEDLLMQEDKLWRILDNIRTNCNFNFAAEDYIEFTQITSIQDSYYTFHLLKAEYTLTQHAYTSLLV